MQIFWGIIYIFRQFLHFSGQFRQFFYILFLFPDVFTTTGYMGKIARKDK